MKMTRLFVMALLVGSLSVLGCGDDEDGGGSAGSGGTAGSGGSAGTGGTAGTGGLMMGCAMGQLCCLELCAGTDGESNALRIVCLDEYNDCIADGGDEATCIALAQETCTI